MLKDDMTRLVSRGLVLACEFKARGETEPHWDICQRLASEFQLWERADDGHERFPIWLSRVVEGLLRDLEEATQ